MIHLNNGEEEHEWVTTEEFEKRFPEVAKALKNPAPDDRLRKIRMKKRVTIRDLSKQTGLSFVQVSQIERGVLTDPKLVDLYIMELNIF